MITLAKSVIGLELVKSFSSKGANIIMLGKDEDKLDELYDEISAHSGKNLIIKSDLRQLDEKGAIQISDEIKKYYENIEGLIHNSELSWQNRNVQPSKVLSPSQNVKVKIINIDKDAKETNVTLDKSFEKEPI